MSPPPRSTREAPLILLGIDFTSTPSRTKPLMVARGRLDGRRLHLDDVSAVTQADGFARLLATPGSWLAAADFSFGLPAAAVARLGWPAPWSAYVAAAAALDRPAFVARLRADQAAAPAGQKYLWRHNDRRARSASPCNLVRPPMALMFHAGAPLLAVTPGLAVPPLRRDPEAARIVVEAYPALVARHLLEDPVYKEGPRDAAALARRAANRQRLLAALSQPAAMAVYGVALVPPAAALAGAVLDDPRGDRLDAVLALVQAAWAWCHRATGFAMPTAGPALQEGWIADPAMAGDDARPSLSVAGGRGPGGA